LTWADGIDYSNTGGKNAAQTDLPFSCSAVAFCVISPTLLAQEQPGQQEALQTSNQQIIRSKLKLRSWSKSAPAAAEAAASSVTTLPLSTYFVESSRDGKHYRGTLVGRDPFHGGGSASVATLIVPVIFKTHRVGVSIDSNGIVSTVSGVRVSNPTVADKACLGTSNNNPLTLFQQSPLLKPAIFDFGGTIVGRTQYVDAFQRGEFWELEDRDRYHVLLGPVKTLSPLFLDVPAQNGFAFDPSVLGICAPLTIIDIVWFDSLLDNVVIPALKSQGVNPSTFPVFFTHNMFWAVPPINDFFADCCIGGYHSITGFPLPIQT
jgi:hypothetical protein